MPLALALCLHGKASSAASASHLEQHKFCKGASFQYNQSLAAHVRLAHFSLWQHVVLPNRAAGVNVGVFLHSWTPEASGLLDELYRPTATHTSRHARS